MQITRAKAAALLNQKEMALYDDSRVNALRQLDAKGLDARIKRARTARDRARDLVQKHKLASRERTGSKRGASGAANQRSKDKAVVMADILKRFEAQAKTVAREAKAAAKPAKKAAKATRKSAKKAAPARTPAAKRAPASKTAAPTTNAAKTAPARKAGGTRKATTSSKPATTSAKRPRKATRKRAITPQQALAQTHALLEAKHEHDREPKPWQDIGNGAATPGQSGYPSDAAQRRAQDLHAAESRIPAIQGSISTRDRINQGKRDHRGDGGE